MDTHPGDGQHGYHIEALQPSHQHSESSEITACLPPTRLVKLLSGDEVTLRGLQDDDTGATLTEKLMSERPLSSSLDVFKVFRGTVPLQDEEAIGPEAMFSAVIHKVLLNFTVTWECLHETSYCSRVVSRVRLSVSPDEKEINPDIISKYEISGQELLDNIRSMFPEQVPGLCGGDCKQMSLEQVPKTKRQNSAFVTDKYCKLKNPEESKEDENNLCMLRELLESAASGRCHKGEDRYDPEKEIMLILVAGHLVECEAVSFIPQYLESSALLSIR